MSTRDRRQFDSILREPLTRQRLLLNGKIRAAQQAEEPQPFTFDDLKSFLTGLQSVNRGKPVDATLAAEINNALAAVSTGAPLQTPKFETPETQLVWGAALAYLLVNPQSTTTWQTPVAAGELRASDLWKQITNTRRAHSELLSHAHHVREALRDKDTRYGWSDPGAGFTFARQKNVINIDLMQSMIVGFEHARADVYREIGSALLSVGYPKRMQQVYGEMQPLMRKMQQAQAKKGPQLKDEEYKQLRLLSAEWQLRHMMFAAAEENVTSRFVANMGKQMLQDYSVSMNNTAVTFRGVGLTRLPKGDQISDELRRYMNLCNTVQLSFYQNNAMFENTDSGWFRVGTDPNLVRKTATLAGRPSKSKDDTDGISHADFQYLRQLCGGPNGLENQQPKQHERLYGWGNLKNRIARSSAERNGIIEQIWMLYAEELIQNILKHTQDQIEQDLKDAKEQQQQQDGDGDDQDGQDQDGDQDGQDGQDGQEGQEGQEGQGGGKPQKGKKGQKPQKNQKQRNKPQGDQVDDPDDMDDGDGDDQDGQKQKGKQDKKDKQKSDKQKGEKGDKSEGDEGEESEGQDGEGEEQDGQDSDKDADGKNSRDGELGADDKNTVPVEGAGDMPAPEAPFEDPSDEMDPNGSDADGDGQDADGQDGQDGDADGDDADADGDDAKTQDQLEKELQEMEDAEAEEGDDADADADGDDADGEGQGKKKGKAKKSKKPSKQAGHGDGQKLGDLSLQDWTQYQQRINELAGPINRVRKLFKDVQERQVQRKQVHSAKLDILPQDGEVMERFNAEAHRNMTIKKLTGSIGMEDLSRFHQDETKLTPTQIDVVLLIDGSGSMSTGRPSALDVSLQAAAIMFEAAAGKDMNINLYVCMWGDKDPSMIIEPGADRVKVGQAMQAARKGLNSGTDFAPAIRKVAETIANNRGKSGVLSGFTHVLILSDGDIGDYDKSREMLQTMFTYTDKVTFDTAIIGSPNTRMEQMSRSVKGHKPFQQLGVTLGKDPNEIPMNIVGLLLDKVRKCGSFNAVPTSQKRRQMQKAHNKMDPKR